MRIVVGERGRVAMSVEMVLRFGYGEIVPWVRKLGTGVLRAVAGPDMVVLRTPVHMRGENMTTVGEFIVGEGDRVPFVLSYGPSHLPVPDAFAADDALKDTEEAWRRWTARGHVNDGPWSEAVRRSLLTLKALTYEPTGGIVAAPTTSLPEFIGGNRNWDYRYCWVRDATLTLLALMNAGYYREAQRWRDWLTRAVAGRPEQMEVMYGVAGERRLTEWEVPHLPGYANSKPVRVGNAAHSQLQLDVFGEVMDTFHQSRRGGLASDESAWEVQIALLDHLEDIWRKPDHGIWEVRTAPLHFTYSKAMAGSRSTAPSRAPRCSACPARSSTGASSASRSTPRSATRAGTPNATASCARTVRAITTRACCCSRRSDSSSPTIRAIAPRSRRSRSISSSTGW